MKSLVCSLLLVTVAAGRAIAAQAAGETADSPRPPQASDRGADIQDLIVWTDARPLLVRLHITVDGKPFRQVARDYLNRLFDELDRDKDGVLSKDEAMRAPPSLNSSPFAFRQPVRPQDLLAAKAGEADGNVSRDAFLAFYERSDAAPFTTAAGPSRSRLGVAAMDLLDTNRDRELSCAELLAAESSLRQRDFDDDEVVTDFELVPGQNQFAAIAVDAPYTGGSTSSLVATVEPSNGGRTVADAILNRYDANKDGKLLTADGDPRELRLSDRVIAELDSNGDHMLDRDELVRFVDRRPDIELSLAIGGVTSTASQETDEQPQGDVAEFPRKTLSDGATQIDVGDAHLEFRLGPTAAGPAIRQAAQAQFRAFDPDNNGYIDEAEFRRVPFIAAAFRALDRDGDGKVFKEEFEAFLERQAAAAATRLVLTVTDEGQQFFELMDKNRDGRLTPREMRAGVDLLSVADTNFDGVLSGGEIPRRLRFDLVRGSNSVAQFGRSIVVSAGMRPQTARGATPTAGPLWFRKMDHNRDGDLSPREFLGPATDFARIDANHDGLIDAREADAAGTAQ
jgi:Ca2+-binding EF-hand superfamily protein